jgi:hypothetical protein
MGITLRLIEEIGFEGKSQLERENWRAQKFGTSLHSR